MNERGRLALARNSVILNPEPFVGNCIGIVPPNRVPTTLCGAGYKIGIGELLGGDKRIIGV